MLIVLLLFTCVMKYIICQQIDKNVEIHAPMPPETVPGYHGE
jgi:hypothetical protein